MTPNHPAIPRQAQRWLITAGPTREAIDPVRFISNRSSGKMGFAMAQAAVEKGHEVVLISGPVSLPTPAGVRRLNVTTAAEMYEAVQKEISAVDVAVFAAAVADYRPVQMGDQKIKKSNERLTLQLERTPDILGSVRAEMNFHGSLIGFAAETENLLAFAQDKLRRKGCDLVIANDVSRPESGFDVDQNEVILVYPDASSKALPPADKHRLAKQLVEEIERIL